MANVLPFKVRVRVIRSLVEGNSVRSTSRLTSTDKDAVVKLGVKVGEGCRKLHDKLVRDVPAGVLEVDEVWGFVGRHERRKLESDPKGFGDQYTMFAVDADTKLVPSYRTGKRTLPTATAFMKDLRARIDGKPQVTVDGWPHWVDALRLSFGHEGVDAGSTVKEYQKECRSDDPSRACGRVKSQKRTVIYGEPDPDRISTSKAERFNLTSRMTDRRLTRLTNAFSRKVENHGASADMHYFWYNFVRVHETIGTTPAVMAGIADHPWTLEEMTNAALAEVGEANKAPPVDARPRRYERKTHKLDVDDPVLAPRRPPGRPRKVRRGVIATPPEGCTGGADCPCADCEARRFHGPLLLPPEAPAVWSTSPGGRGMERGFVALGAVAHVALFTVGVAGGAKLDDLFTIHALGRPVPASGVALGAVLAGAMVARATGSRKVAGAAASLATGLAAGMLTRAVARKALHGGARPALASGVEGAGAKRVAEPWWKRVLRRIFG